MLGDAFVVADSGRACDVIATAGMRRSRLSNFIGADVLLDTFPDPNDVSCAFVRLVRGDERTIRLVVQGVDCVRASPSGGWMLEHSGSAATAYWVPQWPTARTVDSNARILSQEPASLVGFHASANSLSFDVHVPSETHLDFVLWRLPDSGSEVRNALDRPTAIERQPVFLRSSHSTYRRPADLYQCLVHGCVYDNRFVWRRIWRGFRWRICSENEAFSLYHAANGLELATGRRLYTLLKRQILLSVLARQAPDGGWHHGEWTELMESHFRLHNAGVQLLEAALEEGPDDVVRSALARAVSFVATKADKTDVGLWFLHDALEESVEKANAKEAPPWTPTRVLGASPANKLILNTHLDAIVAMARYALITGDTTYDSDVASARAAARTVLAMRPAEWLYAIAYRAIWLSLLPTAQAGDLALPLRAVRRLAREQLSPRLYLLKRWYPRFVMPGGLLDRHLSPRHFDMGYHTVNLMDVVRLWRCFPEENFADLVDGAIRAVTDTGLLDYWAEGKQKQPLGYWVEALYDLATMRETLAYRRYLAEAILCAEAADIGLPPCVLGGDAEAVPITEQSACPSPADMRLRVANLSRRGAGEVLVVNPADEPIDLVWESSPVPALAWHDADGKCLPGAPSPPRIPPRSWVLGRESPAGHHSTTRWQKGATVKGAFG